MAIKGHEHIVFEDNPTPKQLFDLASVGLAAAAEENRIRRLPRSRREHYWIHDLHLGQVAEEGVGEEVFIRHRIAGRVAREYQAVNDEHFVERELMKRAWRMTFFDVYWVTRADEYEEGSRAIYQFAWDKQRATVSQRKIELKSHKVPSPDRDMGDEILNFHLSDDDIPLLHARAEIERVTADDCAILTDDMRSYYSQLRGNRRAA